MAAYGVPEAQAWEHEKRFRSVAYRNFLTERGCRYADCTLDSFQVTDDAFSKCKSRAVEAARSYCNDLYEHIEKRGTSLVLFGPSGTGKDHLMTAVIREAILRWGFAVEWINGQEMFAKIRAGFTEDVSDVETLKDLMTVKVLAVSDVVPPTGGLSEYQQTVLYRLIDYRYSHRLPTWLTLNVASGQQMESYTVVAVVDRLREDVVSLHCNWPSYRSLDTRREDGSK